MPNLHPPRLGPAAARRGRRPNTSRAEIAEAALALFSERGFGETMLDDVAAAVGVSRRTILRYYDSKSDIVWGTFSEQLDGLRSRLAAADDAEPLMVTLRHAIVAFNDYGEEQVPNLRRRIALITTVPTLQGHWIEHEGSDLLSELDHGLALLGAGFDEQHLVPADGQRSLG